MDAFIDKYGHEEAADEADSRQPENKPSTPRHAASRQAPPRLNAQREPREIYIKSRYERLMKLSIH